MHASTKKHEVYLEHFQYRASQIVTLQHPYILPLIDFGVYRGFPYLVSPHIPLRSLHTRIEKNGVLNTEAPSLPAWLTVALVVSAALVGDAAHVHSPLAALNITYRHSLIVRGSGEGKLQAGDRAPDRPVRSDLNGSSTRLFEHLHTLLTPCLSLQVDKRLRRTRGTGRKLEVCWRLATVI